MDQEYMDAARYIVKLTLEGKLAMDSTSFEYHVEGLGLLIWNVSGALTCFQEGDKRTGVSIPLDYMAKVVENYDFNRARVEEVDHTVPGIAAVFWNPLEERGEYAVIDGTHRIKKALGLGVEFPVLLLTAEESYANLVWAPEVVWAGREMLVAWEKRGPLGIEGISA